MAHNVTYTHRQKSAPIMIRPLKWYYQNYIVANRLYNYGCAQYRKFSLECGPETIRSAGIETAILLDTVNVSEEILHFGVQMNRVTRL